MVISCSAYGCTNRWNKARTLKFHSFPLNDPVRLQKWLLAVRRADWQPTKNSFLCGDHFSDDCYRSSARHFLKEDAVPNIFSFTGYKSKKKDSVTQKTRNPLDYQDDVYWSESEPMSSTDVLKDRNSSGSITTASNSISLLHGLHSRSNKRKESDDSVLTPVVSMPVIKHLNRPYAVPRRKSILKSSTYLSNTNSSRSTVTAATSIGTIHGLHSQLNKKERTGDEVLTRNVSHPLKRYLKFPQDIFKLKYKCISSSDCLKDKKSSEPTITALTSTGTIHGPHKEIEIHDAVATRDISLSVNQHSNHSQETASIETNDAVLTGDPSLPVNMHLKQETADTETYDASLPVNKHLKQETPGIETHDAVLTGDASLSINQILNHPQKTAGTEIHDSILTGDASLPVNQPLNSALEIAGDRCEEFGKNVTTKLRELPNQQRMICEKIINDALSKAKQGILTPNHVLCKVKPSYYNFRYKASILAKQIKALSQHMEDSVKS